MMTQMEWYSDTANTAAMLEHLKKSGVGLDTERKRRLFACACARQFWELLTDARSRDAVVAAEAFADDGGDKARVNLLSAWQAAWGANDVPGSELAVAVAAHCCHPNDVPGYAANDAGLGGVSTADLAAMFRDVFGDPWEPLPAAYEFADVTSLGGERRRMSTYTSAPWLMPQVLALAKAAYDDRSEDGSLEADRLAVLSDAMEEEGCGVEVALRHLRGEVICSRCLGAGTVNERDLSGMAIGINTVMSIGGGSFPLQGRRITLAEKCGKCGGKGYVSKTMPCYRGCAVLDWLLGKV